MSVPAVNTAPPDWPAAELEFLGCCPACGSEARALLYPDMTDINYGTAGGRWNIWQCLTCESGYLDPRPTAASILRAYAVYPTHATQALDVATRSRLKNLWIGLRNGYLREKYGLDVAPAYPLGRWLMYLLPPPLRVEWDYCVRHLQKPADGRNKLLDIGCGNGDFLVRMRRAGWIVEGVDFDPKAVQTARAQGLAVIHGTVDDLVAVNRRYDMITANQVIEHVHDIQLFLRQCRSLLAPGGRLWLGTPNFTSRPRRRYGRSWCLYDVPRHLILFTPAALRDALLNAGFTRVRFRHRGWHSAWADRFSRALQRGEKPAFDRKPELSPSAWLGYLLYDCTMLSPHWCEDLVCLAWNDPG